MPRIAFTLPARFGSRRTLGEILAPAMPEVAHATRSKENGIPSVAAWLVPEYRGVSPIHRAAPPSAMAPVGDTRSPAARPTNNSKVAAALASLGFATVGHWLWPAKLLCLPLILYISAHWYQKAWHLARRGQVGIPTLFVVTMSGIVIKGFFWIGSLATLVAQLSIKLTGMVTEDSRNRLVDIYQQVPKTVWLLVDGVETSAQLDQVRIGDTVVVNAGDTVAVDGTIKAGQSLVDEQMLTGEARPVEKGIGEPVFAGTTLLAGRIEIRVEQSGATTTIARIGQILNDTVEYKSNAQLRAERLAQRTVAPTLLAGAVALPILGPMGALAVVDAHFRQRLSVLCPLALMNYLNLAARHGILIKDGRSLDLLHQVDTLVFDKTGTLTDAQPTVAAVHAFAGLEETEVLSLAAAAEYRQAHPIAKAILAEARRRGLSPPPLDQAEYQVGLGLCVTVGGREIRVGSRRFMESSGIGRTARLDDIEAHCHGLGHSLVLLARDGELAGAVELAPAVRPRARTIIAEIKRRHGITATYIISGDQEAPTARLARELDIDHYFAETLPERKAELIERLVGEGRFICYIGDGINDAIALKKSHVSISLRGASAVATDTAQIVLMESDLDHLVKLFDYAHEFRGNTDINFAIVTGTTLIGMGGAFFLGFGLLQTTLLAVGSIAIGVGNSMRPLLSHRVAPPNNTDGQGPCPLRPT